MISIPRGHGFRSGIGATVEDGTQEDWEGLSRNGRQWRNPLTREVRNLAGSAYWELRKAQSADEIIKPDVWTKDGKPNIKAFSDEALGLNQKKIPAKKTLPIAHQIVPQEKTLDRLDKQEEDLRKSLKSQEISEEEFKQLIFALEQKRHRAWKSRCKALGISSDDDPDAEEDEEMLSEWQERVEIVGKNNAEKRDWWRNGNVFILGYERIREGWNSLRNRKVSFSVDKQKAAPYVGFAVIAFSLWVVF